jgi:hypothetical protein
MAKLITRELAINSVRVSILIGLISFTLILLYLWLTAEGDNKLVSFYTNRLGEWEIEMVMFGAFAIGGFVMLIGELKKAYKATKVYAIEK